MSGAFVTLEGGEGCGKSTQAALLAERLSAEGLRVVSLREPGGTAVGDRLRDVLLDPAHHGEVDAWAELFMYEAARAQLVGERIVPELASGAVVICDRFYDSTTAYQGHGRGLDAVRIAELNRIAAHDMVPDATVVLDIDVAEGLARATGQGADRLESEELAFHHRVREGFRALARAEPARVVLVDASGDVDTVSASIWDAVAARLRAKGTLR